MHTEHLKEPLAWKDNVALCITCYCYDNHLHLEDYTMKAMSSIPDTMPLCRCKAFIYNAFVLLCILCIPSMNLPPMPLFHINESSLYILLCTLPSLLNNISWEWVCCKSCTSSFARGTEFCILVNYNLFNSSTALVFWDTFSLSTLYS